MHAIDKVAWICVQDRRVLMVRSHGKARFYLPGGKREPGESDAECLQREVREELGVTLRAESLRWWGEVEAAADGRDDGTRVHLSCYRAEHDGELRACAEIAAYDWLGADAAAQCSLAARQVLAQLQAAGELDPAAGAPNGAT